MDAQEIVTIAPPRIRVRGLGKLFGEAPHQVEALKGIDLDVCENEFVTLVGASGCGKSTLLRIIGGLEYHTSGEILANGKAAACARHARLARASSELPVADWGRQVGILAEDRAVFCDAFYGMQHLGAIPVPLSSTTSAV